MSHRTIKLNRSVQRNHFLAYTAAAACGALCSVSSNALTSFHHTLIHITTILATMSAVAYHMSRVYKIIFRKSASYNEYMVPKLIAYHTWFLAPCFFAGYSFGFMTISGIFAQLTISILILPVIMGYCGGAVMARLYRITSTYEGPRGMTYAILPGTIGTELKPYNNFLVEGYQVAFGFIGYTGAQFILDGVPSIQLGMLFIAFIVLLFSNFVTSNYINFYRNNARWICDMRISAALASVTLAGCLCAWNYVMYESTFGATGITFATAGIYLSNLFLRVVYDMVYNKDAQ